MKVSAVIVTYNPNMDKLLEVVNSLKNQVEDIIIVKNSAELLNLPNCIIIQLNDNMGIGYAQNVGIEKAITIGEDWILLSDQDTVFPLDYIKLMKQKIRLYGEDIVYVPSFFNIVKNQKEAVSLTMKSSIIPEGDEPIKLLHAISSGSLFNISVYKKIGKLEERLFIDYVDFEWCWRAKTVGVKTLCFPDIVINHQLGDSFRNIFGKKITIRSYVRYYYMIRNGLFLSKYCKYLSKKEKKQLYNRSKLFCFGMLLIVKNKIKALSIVIRAYSDVKKLYNDIVLADN